MRSEALLLAGLSLALSCSAHRVDSADDGNGGGTQTSDDTGGKKGTGGVAGSAGTHANSSSSGTGGNGGGDGAAGSAVKGSNEAAGQFDRAGAKGGAREGASSGGSAGVGGKSIGEGTKDGGGPDGKTASGGKKDNGAGNAGGSSNPQTDASPSGSAGGSGEGGASEVGCDRDGLDAAVQSYLAALKAGDSSKMPLGASVKYTEIVSLKVTESSIANGIFKKAQAVDYSRSLLDTTQCQTFTEVFIPTGSTPYVLGGRLTIKDGKISEIYQLDTDSDDWNFDATAFETCSKSEDWSSLPEANRTTREKLIDAGQKYFDIFSDKNTDVPWGSPCYRLEGGKGCTPQMDKSSSSCNVGIPDGITFKNTNWVVDEDVGGVVGITLFGGANPDSHMFRLIDGKIRNIHTLTIMK